MVTPYLLFIKLYSIPLSRCHLTVKALIYLGCIICWEKLRLSSPSKKHPNLSISWKQRVGGCEELLFCCKQWLKVPVFAQFHRPTYTLPQLTFCLEILSVWSLCVHVCACAIPRERQQNRKWRKDGFGSNKRVLLFLQELFFTDFFYSCYHQLICFSIIHVSDPFIAHKMSKLPEM